MATGTPAARSTGAKGALAALQMSAASKRRERRGVEGGEEGVDDRVEVLVADGGQHLEAHALVLDLARADVVRAAVDRHVVAARDEPRRELLGERLEPPVAGRNPPRPQNRDAHVNQ